MAAIKKTIRLAEHTIKVCHNLSFVGDVNWSGSVNSMAEQFLLFVEQATPELSFNEWHAFYCAYNGYMPNPDIKQEAELLHWHISEGYQYDAQITDFIGSDQAAVELVERIKNWSMAEKLAVIYKAQAFWRQGKKESDDFIAITFSELDQLQFKGGISQPQLGVGKYLFECIDNTDYNLVGYNGQHGNHFTIEFADRDVVVLVDDDSIDLVKSEWLLDESIEDKPILNIDAAPEIIHDRLVYPAGCGIYDSNKLDQDA